LNTKQLLQIRDTSTLPAKPQAPDPSGTSLSPLQHAALCFADASTKHVQVPDSLTTDLLRELTALAETFKDGKKKEDTEDLLVECAAVTASYNMVSRFLVSLDVAGVSREMVPWPSEHQEVIIIFLLSPFTF
jgi:hypothetical protein